MGGCIFKVGLGEVVGRLKLEIGSFLYPDCCINLCEFFFLFVFITIRQLITMVPIMLISL